MARNKFVLVGAALAALWTVQAHASNLVTNGGFETGDFTGWTIAGDGIGIDTAFPNTGSNDAVFTSTTADTNPGTLSQSLTTVANQSYTLTFAVQDEAGQSVDTFTASFGGFSATITGDQAAGSYTLEHFTIPGSDIGGTSTLLSFQGLSDPLSGQAWNLDDVSLSPAGGVPEPATWAMMLTGFGLLGFALRRRRGTELQAAI